MLFYQVVLNGKCQNVDIRNILYYREGVGFPWGENIWGGSEVIADNVLQEVWPALKVLLPDDYTLESIDVYPHNDLFQLNAQMPYTLSVQQPALWNGGHMGTAAVVNFKFNLEPAGLMNGVWPPRFGYVAIGPFPGDWLLDTGYINPTVLSAAVITDIQAALSQNLEFLLPFPGTFYPIRVRHNRVLGSLVRWKSWADVSSAVAQPRASFRRSRIPE